MTAFARGVRRSIRLPMLVLLLLGGLTTVLGVFPMMTPARRQATIAGWSRMLLFACGVRLQVTTLGGALPLARRTGGRMLAANHISWLDIFLIDAVAPASFIAKSDIERWPLIGTLVGRTGTLFLERGKRHAVRDALHKLQHLVTSGARVAVFPEGTTGDGLRILPFHGNLLEAALRSGRPIDPVAISYCAPEGGPSPAMDYTGDITFVDSVWRIIGEHAVIARVIELPSIEPREGLTRHVVALTARQVIADALALPLDDVLPEVVQAIRAGRG